MTSRYARTATLAVSAMLALVSLCAGPAVADELTLTKDRLAAADKDVGTFIAVYGEAPEATQILGARLYRAVLDGDLAAAKALLAHGVKPRRLAGELAKWSPLQLAIQGGNDAMRQLLLAHGADPRDAAGARRVKDWAYSYERLACGIAADNLLGRAKSQLWHVAVDDSIAADMAAQREREAREAAEREAAEKAEAAREAAEERARVASAAAQERLWLDLQRAVLGRQGARARTLYAGLDDAKRSELVTTSLGLLSADIAARRGRLVYLEGEFEAPAPGGALLTLSQTSARVLLSGVPTATLVSGEPITCFARIRGVYRYTTVVGSTNTVPHVHLDLRL